MSKVQPTEAPKVEPAAFKPPKVPKLVITPEQSKEALMLMAARDELATINITSVETAQAAGAKMLDFKSRATALDTQRKAITKPLDTAKGLVMDLFRPALEAAAFFETGVKAKLAAWNKSETERIAKEQREAEDKAKKEREALEKKAEKAIESGNVEKGEELQMRANSVVAAPTSFAPAKIAGVSFRPVHKCRLLDIRKLMQSILDGKAPANLVIFDEAEANRLAVALKGSMTYEGIEFYEDTGVSGRA